MKISAYCYTNKGGRPHNEDSVCCAVNGNNGCFVLADGLGGHQCGEVASALAADILFDGCKAASPDETQMIRLFQAANTRILEEQAKNGPMKTTAVALSVENDTAVWAYIGDSRLYHFSGSRLASVTQDHSVSYRKYMGGEISYMDICHDDDRSSLLRVLGKADCRPESAQAALAHGDAFLLCSDGFWEYVYLEEMLADLAKAETPQAWAELLLLRHIRRTSPGNDNFSLIAVFVEEEL